VLVSQELREDVNSQVRRSDLGGYQIRGLKRDRYLLDAKMALPERGKSKDLASDVAAMANDGGALLYGVGEDEHGRLTVPNPFELNHSLTFCGSSSVIPV
jgi:hypothetical protein